MGDASAFAAPPLPAIIANLQRRGFHRVTISKFWNLCPNRNENPHARNARQFAIAAKCKSAHAQNFIMKIPVMLLLTNDRELEDSVAEALLELGEVSHLTHNAGNALETVCGVHDLDLAVIDFEHGPHGMTLLSAITILRKDLPIIVITRDDDKHVEALAYANGATACFPKPVSATHLARAIRELQRSKSELTPA
ncbi:MAG: hypothetical protein Udaeo2_19900 [Candidatus Udaeobacter sp.]|jgi:CheY-like chemotaxis protein|nr:MAG: hypothetical protein Udaeo2_19900 [Candidatus Udaeobacter sp.]